MADLVSMMTLQEKSDQLLLLCYSPARYSCMHLVKGSNAWLGQGRLCNSIPAINYRYQFLVWSVDVQRCQYHIWWSKGKVWNVRPRWNSPICWDTIIVETAYCASPTEYKSKAAPFKETPEGQREFLDAVNRIVMDTPDNLGVGVFWWEPATMGGRAALIHYCL